KKACNATFELDASGSWRSDAREQFEQGALSGSVLPDNSNGLALFDLKVNILQTPDDVALTLYRTIICLCEPYERVGPSHDPCNEPAFKVETDRTCPELAQLVHFR